MPTLSSMSIARLRRSAWDSRSCAAIVSMIWSPMEKTGFREVIGSWKIIEIPGPRMRCMSRSDMRVRFCPLKTTSPAATRAGHVAQPIAKQVEPHHRDHQRDTGDGDDPGGLAHEVAALGHDVPPGRR